jgi:low affinity Fe/Cu permease
MSAAERKPGVRQLEHLRRAGVPTHRFEPAATLESGNVWKVTRMATSQFFSHAAQWTSRECGRPLTFGLAFGIIVVWGVSGPLFHYSDTWQLVINTGTTVVTFLMVFLIQNTQNRDASAVQLKLDELIRASSGARNRLLMLEDLTEAELDKLKESFSRIADRGGIGAGTLREVEADLDQAEEGIEKAEDKIAAGRG